MKGIITPDVARLWQQTRGNPITALVPLTLTTAINTFDQGYLRQLSLIFDRLEMGADLDIATCAPKRRQAISGLPWEITVADELEDDEEAEAELHREALSNTFNHLSVKSAVDLDEEGEVRLLVENIMQALFMRYDVHEILWQPRGADLTAELIHAPVSLFEATRGGLAYCGPFQTLGKSLLNDERDGWLVAKHKQTLAVGLSAAWMFKSMCLRDWLEYNEGYGLPGIHGLTAAPPKSDDWNNFANAINECVARFKFLTGKDNELKLIETAGQGGTAYEPLFKLMQRAQITLCLGNDLSTLSQENSQGASVQAGDSSARIASDARFVEDTLNRRLVRTIIANVFGEGTQPLAWFRLRPPLDRDDELEMKKDEFLMNNGVPITIQQLAEKHGHSLAVEVPADTLAGTNRAEPKAKQPDPQPGNEGLAIDNAFNPGQLRDRQGRWTKGYEVPTGADLAGLRAGFEEMAAFYAEPEPGQEEAVVNLTPQAWEELVMMTADRQREQNLVDTYSANHVESWPLPREQRQQAQALEGSLWMDHNIAMEGRALQTARPGNAAADQQRQQLLALRKLATKRRNEARKNVRTITAEINHRLANLGTDIEADDVEQFLKDEGWLNAAHRAHKAIDAFDGGTVTNEAQTTADATPLQAIVKDIVPVLEKLRAALAADDADLLKQLQAIQPEAVAADILQTGNSLADLITGALGQTFADAVGLPDLIAEVLAEEQAETNDQ